MNTAQILTALLFITAGAFQEACGRTSCRGTEYYNEPMNECCATCPAGQVKRIPCVKDIETDCAKPCKNGNSFIDWNPSPRCRTCKKCLKESLLVYKQHCSLLSEAICQCQSGYYCQTPFDNTCARCLPHTECPPGQGVKQKGTPVKDTECEVCRSGTYSDVKSATEGCKPHTDCAKLHHQTARKGNAATDTLCQVAALSFPVSTERSKPQKSTWAGDMLAAITTVGRDVIYTTPGMRTFSELSQTKSPTPAVPYTVITTKGGGVNTDKANNVYLVAGLICVVMLLVAFLLIWKQKICNLKLWIIKRKKFIPSVISTHKTEITYKEDCEEGNLLQRQNSTPSQNVIPESHQRLEMTQSEWLADDKPDIQQGRDHLNNRIEKIYIMNADTVLVGSISEVPNRRRSGPMECESKESQVLASRYPEQESSKVPVNDLMLSVEEEERDTCSAKMILQI